MGEICQLRSLLRVKVFVRGKFIGCEVCREESLFRVKVLSAEKNKFIRISRISKLSKVLVVRIFKVSSGKNLSANNSRLQKDFVASKLFSRNKLKLQYFIRRQK